MMTPMVLVDCYFRVSAIPWLADAVDQRLLIGALH